jgi:hypothetical protein
MKNTIFYFVICVLAPGCTSISNVSKKPEFSTFLDREVILKKPVLVCRDELLDTEDGSRVTNKIVSNVNLTNKCRSGETVGLLPSGSTVNIEKIEKHKVFSLKTATHIYFIGNATFPTGVPFRFYYFYGHEGFNYDQPW